MPQVTLIVCVRGDREHLTRLLEHSIGCYDELLVVHDGPDLEDVASLVQSYGGRFVERERAFSQEPHLPFAFEEASHDWILRFDADEYPSAELRDWILTFRRKTDNPPKDLCGYQCIWPAWNGKRSITKRWPNSRIFLFRRDRIGLIGLCENGPLPDPGCHFQKLPLTLFHRPGIPTHGIRNIFGKDRTAQAKTNLVKALLGSPMNQPRWRYESNEWPANWEEVRDHPLATGLLRLIFWPVRQAAAMLLVGDFPRPSVFAHAGVFHATLCFAFWRERRNRSQHAK